MARKFYWEIVCDQPPRAGLVLSGQRDYISVDDLPRVDGSVATTFIGSITTDPTGRVTAIAPWADGAYNLITVLGGLATPSTTSPPPSPPTPPTRVFSHLATVGSVGSSETDLYTDTLTAGLFAANNDVVEIVYTGTFVNSLTNARRLRFYFNGSTVYDTGTFNSGIATQWTMWVTLIRVDATTVRANYTLDTLIDLKLLTTSYTTEITPVTLSGTVATKITGTAVNDNDIVTVLGYATKFPAS